MATARSKPVRKALGVPSGPTPLVPPPPIAPPGTTQSARPQRTLEGANTGLGVENYYTPPPDQNQPSLDDIIASGDTRAIQQALANAGFDPGKIDGIMGRRTQAAINAYQNSKNQTGADQGTPGGGLPGGGEGGAPGVPGGAGTPPQPAEKAPSTLDATDYLRGVLSQWGLESLVPQAMKWMQNGYDGTMIQQAMTTTPEFVARFPAIKQRQDAGLPAIGPGEYVLLERQYAQTLAQAGLPKGFYDRPSDFTNLIAKDVSATELKDRITQGYQRVTQAPQEVRDYFAQKFGASGDAALASVFLDPSRALSELERQAQEAEIGGTGMQFGFNVAEPLANTLAAQGVTGAQARQGFEKLSTESDLFKATVGEANQPALTQETGIKAEFGVSGEAGTQMRQRMEERRSEFSKGKAGGAEETKKGIMGLAAAGT